MNLFLEWDTNFQRIYIWGPYISEVGTGDLLYKILRAFPTFSDSFQNLFEAMEQMVYNWDGAEPRLGYRIAEVLG